MEASQEPNLTVEELAEIQLLLDSKKTASQEQVQELEIDEGKVLDAQLPKQLINLGSANDLLSSDYRKQIVFLKEELNFSLGRVWNFFVEEMNVDLIKEHKINFDRIDSVLDFLIEIKVTPFIELGYKIKRIRRDVNLADTPMLSLPSYESTTKDWQWIITSFMDHIVRRYGHKEVSSWYFELSRDEKSITEYIQQYIVSYQVIKQINSAIRLGGTGFKINFDRLSFEDELKNLEDHKIKLDFLSFMMFPYERANEETQRNSKQINDPNYLEDAVNEAIEKIKQTGYKDCPLYITEWGNSISNRNKMNDLVFKGTYTIRNYISILGKVDMISYWIASDLYSDFVDAHYLLNGASGMLSKNSIPKPFFYAIKFLFSLKGEIVFKSQNLIVVKQDSQNYQLLCHNIKELNYRYYLKAESEISYEEAADFYSDNNKMKVRAYINNLLDGRWRVKTSVINEIYGNVINIWEKLGFETELSKDDIQYIKRITIPRLFIEKKEGRNVLITKELLANEFCLIKLTRD